MEKKTMGAFLAALRKANGYTQQEVADKLNVSNKTVSKWERDEGCPEIMMLPAIAELYSVTVDEILRGERIIKPENEQINEEKTEKRAKYLFDKAQSRFTNLSFISIALGVLASILAYLTWELSYNYASKTVCILLVVLTSCASVIIQIVAFNNFRTNFNTEENIIDKKITGKTKKKALIYLCITICLVIIAVIGITTVIINFFDPYPFIPVNIFISGAIAFTVYRIMYKKIGADEDDKVILSPEFLAYRKKHIKITSIFVAVVMVVCMVIPFAGAIIGSITSRFGYSFSDNVGGVSYYSIKDAENDYYKLKDFFQNGKKLYTVEMEDDTILYVYELEAHSISEKSDDNGELVSASYEVITTVVHTKEFSSFEEVEEFKYNNCWDNYFLNLYSIQNNLSFDDENLSIYYTVSPNFTGAVDILPVFLLIGSCVSITVAVISYLIYYRKKKEPAV